LFRSDRLDRLTPSSLSALDSLGISTVVDLRYQSEIDESPSQLWPLVSNHVEVPMAPENSTGLPFMERVANGEYDGLTDEVMAEMYGQLLDRHRVAFVDAITASVSTGPALFHCSAGKDRTGLMAMLILSVLGVSDTDIMTDFDLTNRYRTEEHMAEMAPQFVDLDLDIESFRPIMSAPVPAIERALSWIEAGPGTAEAYLVDAGMSQVVIDQMREDLIV